MAGQLGSGVRVRIGWCATHQVDNPDSRDPRMKRGVIKDGPFHPGQHCLRRASDGLIMKLTAVMWEVLMDGDPTSVLVAEYLLIPEDDEDPPAEDVDVTKPTEETEEA